MIRFLSATFACCAFVASVTARQASAAPMNCKVGQPVTVQTGFFPSAGDPKLSCVSSVGACVDNDKCPTPPPGADNCKKGKLVMIPTGFTSIGGGLSCTNYQSACVDSSKCPAGGPILCRTGSHAVYLTVGFVPSALDPELKCRDERARCVDDSLGCPKP